MRFFASDDTYQALDNLMSLDQFDKELYEGKLSSSPPASYRRAGKSYEGDKRLVKLGYLDIVHCRNYLRPRTNKPINIVIYRAGEWQAIADRIKENSRDWAKWKYRRETWGDFKVVILEAAMTITIFCPERQKGLRERLLGLLKRFFYPRRRLQLHAPDPDKDGGA